MTRTDIILQRLGLRITRRRGTRAWMLCPFHQAPTDPIAWGTTFFVRTAGARAGNYLCFSCRESGGLVSLVERVRGCERDEAIAFVKEAGKGWKPPKAKARIVRRAPVLGRRRFAFPEEVILGELETWDTLPRRYAEERGITAEQVRAFGLGFAIDGALAGRIVFPVRVAPDARIVSYSARTFVDEQPRYKTPLEAEHADLDAIFGEHLWPALADRRCLSIAVTEGAIDALAVARTTGITIGALGGSDVRPGHITSLATFGGVVILTDNDPPGEHAATKIRMMLGRHVTTERVRLPTKRDAATMAKEDPTRLRHEVERALTRMVRT